MTATSSPAPEGAAGRAAWQRLLGLPKLELSSLIRPKILHVLGLKILAAALLVLMNLVLARRLSEAEFGSYGYALALTPLLVRALSLGWPTALPRFVVQYADAREWGYVRGFLERAFQFTLIVSLSGSCVLLLVASLGRETSAALSESLRFAAWVLPIAALMELRRQSFQAFRAPRLSVIYEEALLPAIVVVGCIVGSVQSFRSATRVYVGAAAFVAIFSSFRLRKLAHGLIAPSRPMYATRRWLRSTVPMVLGGLSYTLLGRIGILLLGTLGNMGEVGLFTAANKIALLFTFALGSVELVAGPKLTSAFFNGRIEAYHRVLWRASAFTTLVALPLLAITVLFPAPVLRLFGPGYASASWTLRILAVGQFVNVATGPVGLALMVTGGERTVAMLTGIATVFATTCCVILIPTFGALGAAIGTAAGLALLNLSLLFAVARHEHAHV